MKLVEPEEPRTIHGVGATVTRLPDGRVVLALSNLAARRLMLGLAVNTKRYGPEVATMLNAMCQLLYGISTGAVESNSPHGRACCICPYCQEVFRGSE